jgi:hypothetical protein
MRRRRNIIIFCLIVMAAGAAFLAWTEFGNVWMNDYGVQAGFFAGVVAGAMALPLIRDPEIAGRFVVGAVIGLLIVGVYQLVEFSILIQGSPGLLSTNQAAMSRFGQETIWRLLYGVGGGAILSTFIVVPHLVILGSLLGIILGGLIGGLSHPFLADQGVVMSRELFMFLIGLLTMAILLVFSSGSSTSSQGQGRRKRTR